MACECCQLAFGREGTITFSWYSCTAKGKADVNRGFNDLHICYAVIVLSFNVAARVHKINISLKLDSMRWFS